mmetsp:Transcript_7645/g.47211  ORF Transcript_7645/g.47211 Transcript_7645/m.47211 type:complete len:144 (-) Transcript_7645:759-1190(-)
MEESQARKARLQAIAAAHGSTGEAPTTSVQQLPKPFADVPSGASLPAPRFAMGTQANHPDGNVAHAPNMPFVRPNVPNFAPRQMSGGPRFIPRRQDDRFPKRGRTEGNRTSQHRERVMEGCRYFKKSMIDDPWMGLVDEQSER